MLLQFCSGKSFGCVLFFASSFGNAIHRTLLAKQRERERGQSPSTQATQKKNLAHKGKCGRIDGEGREEEMGVLKGHRNSHLDKS